MSQLAVREANNLDRAPAIADTAADSEFRRLATELGLKPDSVWVGGYTAHEWQRGRHILQSLGESLEGKRALEFGCNVGATAVVAALLGLRVDAVDVDSGLARLAVLNTRRYGVSGSTTVRTVVAGQKLDFPDETFDLVICNSSLEYVHPDALAAVQGELDRVLKVGGILVVIGTSNRLAPKEVHSGRWLANYLPRKVDRWLGTREIIRGVTPWGVLRGFGNHYANLDVMDAGRGYLEARRRMGYSPVKLAALRVASTALRPLSLSVGLLTPSLSVCLKKTASSPLRVHRPPPELDGL